MRGRIFVKWGKGKKSFKKIGNALEFANKIIMEYNEIPFIYDEF